MSTRYLIERWVREELEVTAESPEDARAQARIADSRDVAILEPVGISEPVTASTVQSEIGLVLTDWLVPASGLLSVALFVAVVCPRVSRRCWILFGAVACFVVLISIPIGFQCLFVYGPDWVRWTSEGGHVVTAPSILFSGFLTWFAVAALGVLLALRLVKDNYAKI